MVRAIVRVRFRTIVRVMVRARVRVRVRARIEARVSVWCWAGLHPAVCPSPRNP